MRDIYRAQRALQLIEHLVDAIAQLQVQQHSSSAQPQNAIKREALNYNAGVQQRATRGP